MIALKFCQGVVFICYAQDYFVAKIMIWLEKFRENIYMLKNQVQFDEFQVSNALIC